MVMGQIPVLVLIALLVIAGGWLLLRQWGRGRSRGKAEGKGSSGPQRLKLPGFKAFRHLEVGRFSFDTILVSRDGVFVVETGWKPGGGKARRGNRSSVPVVNYEQGKLRFPGSVVSEPIERVANQAHWVSGWLSRAAGVPVRAMPVLVLAGWRIETKKPADVPVISPGQATAFFTRTKVQLFSDNELRKLAEQLGAKSRVEKK